MALLRRWRARWLARRRELALQQIEAQRQGGDLVDRNPVTDAFSGQHYASRRALGGLLNPKATSHTEWRGD